MEDTVRRRWLAGGLVMALGHAGCSSDQPAASSVDLFGISRGAYLVGDLIDCGGCHTSDPTKPFGGGVKFPVDSAGHYVYSRNLTSDPKTGLKLTEDEFVKALQTGEDFTNHGQALLVMPWPNFRWMATDDLKALYAFLKALPPVDNAVPPDNKGPAGMQGPVPLPAQYNEGEEARPLPPQTAPVPLAPPGTPTDVPDPDHAVRGAAIMPLSYAKMPNFYKRTAEEQAAFGRGSYLVNAAVCSDCHTNKGGSSRSFAPGPDFLKIPADSYLIGGATFSVPGPLNPLLKQTRTMSANLIGTSGYFNEPKTTYLSFAAIIDAMAHVDDSPPLPIGWPMPADHFRKLATGDLSDIYTYMKILAEDYDHTGQTDKSTQGQARYCTGNADCQAGETCFVDPSASKTVNNQCVGKACMDDSECGACQKCAASTCQPPAASDACLATGL
jgi:mono/diheme cytochrome c family protein